MLLPLLLNLAPDPPGAPSPSFETVTEIYKSSANGNPVPVMRMYMTAGATYRKAFTFSEIDTADVVISAFDFTNWEDDGWRLELAATDNSTPVVIETSNITKQGDGELQVVVTDTNTKLLQTSSLKNPVGFLEGVDDNGDRRALATVQAYVTFTPN